MNYETRNIRNVAIMGHSGEGKTSLCEAILFNAKATDRLGKILDGNTVMDFDEQEIAKKLSISLSVANCEFNGKKFNLMDVPGFYDFEGEGIQALSAADSAIIVLGPWGTVSVGCEKAIESCEKSKIPMMVFINQVDKENANVLKTTQALQEMYGTKVAVISLPILEGPKMVGYVTVVEKKAYRFNNGDPKEIEVPADMIDEMNRIYATLTEVAAENDEELFDKFMDGVELTQEEVILGLKLGFKMGTTIPVMAGSAYTNSGVIALMAEMVKVLPSPLVHQNDLRETSKGSDVPCEVWIDGQVSLKVFKTIADPFVGKLNVFKVMTGTLKSGMILVNHTNEKTEKVGQLLILKGKKQYPVEKLVAGDIGALAKLQYTNTGDTLAEIGNEVKYSSIVFPKPVISMAVGAVKSGEEEKVIQGLYRLLEEDITFQLVKSKETAEMLICGMGETHIEIICKKLKTKFGVEAQLSNPKIPYRESIKKIVEAEGKRKKQSGGHGQYGHCKIRFEPCEEDFVFTSEVVGGSVPKQYIPAIEKGLQESLKKGVLAGYPVVGLKAVVYDGSYHDVDSSEMAFKLAASNAFKDGLANAKPVLLEPVMSVKITVPENYMGDILGDMNKRRGRILGMEADENKQVIMAESPQSEMFKYATDLRSITQGRGIFSMEFARYEEVPQQIADKLAKARNAENKD